MSYYISPIKLNEWNLNDRVVVLATKEHGTITELRKTTGMIQVELDNNHRIVLFYPRFLIKESEYEDYCSRNQSI